MPCSPRASVAAAGPGARVPAGFSISGDSGGGGSAGEVKITNSGALVETVKENATAIYAQSIGGGGDKGGAAISAGAFREHVDWRQRCGGRRWQQKVTVDSLAGDILTTGNRSYRCCR